MSDSCNAINLSTFAFSLFSTLAACASETNILISPFSIASALSLVLAGATRGSLCEKELSNILNVVSHEDFPILSQTLLHSKSTGSSVSLTSANGIWSKALKESYISTIHKVHDAEANDLPKSFDPINRYIARKTNGLVKNMLSGDVDPLTVAVLVNAVHFKGDWTVQFDKDDTYSGEFTTSSGEKRDAMFMFAKRKMQFATNVSLLNGASIIQLDYGKAEENNGQSGSDYAALFILPEQRGHEGLNGVINQLANLTVDNSSSSFDAMLEQMSSHQKAELSLPRFKMEYGTKSLTKELRALGLGSCFDGTNVLNEMSDDPLVHVDEVLHKAIIEVTEEGTEAAAATVGVIMTRSLPKPVPKIRLDRPFIMIILHLPTKTPLFVAKVDDPELNF